MVFEGITLDQLTKPQDALLSLDPILLVLSTLEINMHLAEGLVELSVRAHKIRIKVVDVMIGVNRGDRRRMMVRVAIGDLLQEGVLARGVMGRDRVRLCWWWIGSAREVQLREHLCSDRPSDIVAL